MEKAQEILFHIDELYTENPSEEKIIKSCEANPTRYQAWVDAFREYDLSDVLRAIDNFWEFKSSKTKPNVAQIKAILTTHNAEKINQTSEQAQRIKLPTPSSLMEQDIQDGNCHHNLPTYEAAYKLIVQDWLADLIPADVYANASFPRNVELAWQNGLFNRFDEALKQCSQKKFGRPYQFESENDAKAQNLGDSLHSLRMTFNTQDDAVKTLSAHWRVA